MPREPFLKLLYVTPERIVKALGTRDILTDLYNNEMLARFVVDEAHCVSSWGHDFRKEYGQLGVLRAEYPEVPIVALTATARKRVADDTMKILNMEKCVKFNTGVLLFVNMYPLSAAHCSHRPGFDRPNLFFEVREKPSRKG